MYQFNSYNSLSVQPSDDYQNLNIPMNYDNFDREFQKSPIAINSSSSLLNIPTPVLQNVVSTVSLGTRLDLQKIALYARNTEYNPSRFAPVVMRIREPRSTALIFSSGKIVCAGAKSEETCRQASRKYAKIVQNLGFETKFKDFKIHNMVATCDVCFPIQLRGIHYNHRRFSSYEPEIFPGLHYRMVNPKVVIVIFASGKLNITGAKNLEDIDNAFRQIYPILKIFKV